MGLNKNEFIRPRLGTGLVAVEVLAQTAEEAAGLLEDDGAEVRGGEFVDAEVDHGSVRGAGEDGGDLVLGPHVRHLRVARDGEGLGREAGTDVPQPKLAVELEDIDLQPTG